MCIPILLMQSMFCNISEKLKDIGSLAESSLYMPLRESRVHRTMFTPCVNVFPAWNFADVTYFTTERLLTH